MRKNKNRAKQSKSPALRSTVAPEQSTQSAEPASTNIPGAVKLTDQTAEASPDLDTAGEAVAQSESAGYLKPGLEVPTPLVPEVNETPALTVFEAANPVTPPVQVKRLEALPKSESEKRREQAQRLQKKKKRRRHKNDLRQRRLVILLSVLIFVLIFFAATLFFFESHYPLNTYFRGNNVSLMPKYKQMLSQLDDVFTIHSSYAGDLTFNLKDFDGQISTEISNNPYAIRWIEHSIQGLSLEGEDSYYYNESKLRAWLAKQLDVLQGDQLPENAKLEINSRDVELIEAKNSNIFADPEVFVDAVIEAVNSGDNQISADDYYRKPNIRSEDLQAEYERLSAMEIEIPELKLTLGPDKVSKFYDESGKLIDKKIEDYVWSLSEKYDTYNRTREFTTIFGTTIQIPPGIYGWRMDIDATVKNLKKILEKSGHGELKIEYKMSAVQHGDDDLGDTYIEVSIENQTVYLVSKGQIISSYRVVTGDVSKGRGTDVGVHMILDKQPSAVLQSVSDDPEWNYRVDVNYWMPFNWAGEGFHSAPWFADWQFGGSTYYGNGSHGCVNMRYSDVQDLFNRVEVGIPVIVY
ncbi:MAG: L,D-transpeptidase family protein [Eubacteriales bacterium]|nr:L,D-transpeptidase family protein [Eubacteriales bacterium]